MPWKKNDLVEQRYDLVRQMKAGELTVSELCRRAKVSRQTAYKWRKRYLSSLSVDVRRFARAVRSHWSIENQLHWVMDVNFKEDQSRARSGSPRRRNPVVSHQSDARRVAR